MYVHMKHWYVCTWCIWTLRQLSTSVVFTVHVLLPALPAPCAIQCAPKIILGAGLTPYAHVTALRTVSFFSECLCTRAQTAKCPVFFFFSMHQCPVGVAASRSSVFTDTPLSLMLLTLLLLLPLLVKFNPNAGLGTSSACSWL